MRQAVLVFALLLSAALAQSFGVFTYYKKIDPVTDKDASFISTDNLETGFMKNGWLRWRCIPEGFYVNVATDEFLNTDAVQGQYRFDKKTASPVFDWEPSTDGTGAFLPKGRLKAFTTAAKGSAQVIVRLFDYQGTGHTYTFKLAGLSAAIKKLSCAKGY